MRGDAPEDRRRPPARPVDEDSRPEERESFRACLDLDRAWRDLCRLRDDGLLELVDLGMGGEGIGSPEQARTLGPPPAAWCASPGLPRAGADPGS